MAITVSASVITLLQMPEWVNGTQGGHCFENYVKGCGGEWLGQAIARESVVACPASTDANPLTPGVFSSGAL